MAEERTIKFIWDYYGPPSARTAEHHKIHLQEFAEAKNLSIQKAGWEKKSDSHSIAFIFLKEKDALEFKDILRPEKAYVVKEEEL